MDIKTRLTATIIGLALIHNVFNFLRTLDLDPDTFFLSKSRPSVSSPKKSSLPDGFAAFKWGAPVKDFAQLKLISQNTSGSLYELGNPQRWYPPALTGNAPPQNTRLFFRQNALAYAIMELSADQGERSLKEMTDRYGKPHTSKQDKSTVHRWQNSKTAVILLFYDNNKVFLQMLDMKYLKR